MDGALALEEEMSQMPVDKFTALVAVKAKQLKGERVFDIQDLFLDLDFTFAVNGPLFGPTGGNTDGVESVDKMAGQGITAMGGGVGFEETGFGFIPLIGFDGDVVFEEEAGFSGAASLAGVLDADGLEDTVDGIF